MYQRYLDRPRIPSPGLGHPAIQQENTGLEHLTFTIKLLPHVCPRTTILPVIQLSRTGDRFWSAFVLQPDAAYPRKPASVMKISTQAIRSAVVTVVLGSFLLPLPACRSTGGISDHPEPPALSTPSQPPAHADANARQPQEIPFNPLLIRSGSQLSISVLVAGQREVHAPSVRVSEAGAITMPLVGPVRVAGRSLQSVEQLLQALYGRFFVSPQVTVDIIRDEDSDAFPWGFVTVLGRVKRQGRVAIPPTRDLTVSSAIQQAGGLDTSARISAVRVTRRLPDGEQTTLDVNLRSLGRRGRADQDIQLQPNDIVFVPEMLF